MLASSLMPNYDICSDAKYRTMMLHSIQYSNKFITLNSIQKELLYISYDPNLNDIYSTLSNK